MTNEEAKFYLAAYRPGGGDAQDPSLTAALAQARRDPSLAAWLEREKAHDAAVAAKLNALPPPAGLREAILAGARVSTPPRRSRSVWLSLAATFTVLLVVGGVYFRRPPATELAALSRYAMDDLAGPHLGATHASDLPSIGAWLENPSNRLAQGLPVTDTQLATDGCRVIRVAGHEVFEICFKRGEWFHLYIGQRDHFRAGASDTEPMFSQRGTTAVATWADANHVYVLASHAGIGALRRLF